MKKIYVFLSFTMFTLPIYAKLAVVTGASRGIGYALTEQLLECLQRLHLLHYLGVQNNIYP